MRMPLLVLAAATLLAVPPATADPSPVLATKAQYAGGSVAGICVLPTSCLSIQVRAGERYLHLLTSAPVGDVLVDVKTAAGVVRVCQSTKVIGPLPVEGLSAVGIAPVLDQVGCGDGPAPTGTVLAIFSKTALSLEDALAQMQPDTTRVVSGGIPAV